MSQTTPTVLNQRTPSPAEVVDSRIRELEEKYDLLQFKVDGWCVWPLFRLTAGLTLQEWPVSKKEKLSLKKLCVLTAKDIVGLGRLRKSRYLVKTLSSARLEREGDRWKDIYFDDLLLEIGDYFKIETTDNKNFLYNRHIPVIQSDLTTTALNILAGQLTRAGRPRAVSTVASKLYECFRQEPGLENFNLGFITRPISDFYFSKRLYAQLLKRIRPKYVLVVDFGAFDLAAASKEQGIKVIEFQHGSTVGPHYAYSWSSYARPYKSCMPLPDRLFLYGEYWREELVRNGFWDQELRSVGSARVDRYRRIKSSAHKEDQICTILLTMSEFNVEKAIAFISDFLELVRGKMKLNFFIKLHPRYERNKEWYTQAFKSKKEVQVVFGGDPPSTFELLTRAHLHISVFSACHYEALALGVPTVILPFVGHENVLDLYKRGHAFLVQTPKDLLEIALHWRDHTVPDEVGKRYFREGALENIKRELGYR